MMSKFFKIKFYLNENIIYINYRSFNNKIISFAIIFNIKMSLFNRYISILHVKEIIVKIIRFELFFI